MSSIPERLSTDEIEFDTDSEMTINFDHGDSTQGEATVTIEYSMTRGFEILDTEGTHFL